MGSGYKGNLIAFICCCKMREDENLVLQHSSQATNYVMIFYLEPLGKHTLNYTFKNSNQLQTQFSDGSVCGNYFSQARRSGPDWMKMEEEEEISKTQ